MCVWGAGGKGSDDICEDFQKLVKYKTDPEPQKIGKDDCLGAALYTASCSL